MKTAFKIKYFQLNVTQYNILYYSKCVEVEILHILFQNLCQFFPSVVFWHEKHHVTKHTCISE